MLELRLMNADEYKGSVRHVIESLMQRDITVRQAVDHLSSLTFKTDGVLVRRVDDIDAVKHAERLSALFMGEPVPETTKRQLERDGCILADAYGMLGRIDVRVDLIVDPPAPIGDVSQFVFDDATPSGISKVGFLDVMGSHS